MEEEREIGWITCRREVSVLSRFEHPNRKVARRRREARGVKVTSQNKQPTADSCCRNICSGPAGRNFCRPPRSIRASPREAPRIPAGETIDPVADPSLMPRYCIRSDNFRAISYFLDYPIYTPLPSRHFSSRPSFSRSDVLLLHSQEVARGCSGRVIVEELERGDLSDRGLLIKTKRMECLG